MATFLFVHGAFVGGWSWKKVTALLRTAGHEVYTPTLTGLGERVHLLNPDIDLETHIQDILEVISYEDLAGVILVGHSYSGLVIASVADRVPLWICLTRRIVRLLRSGYSVEVRGGCYRPERKRIMGSPPRRTRVGHGRNSGCSLSRRGSSLCD